MTERIRRQLLQWYDAHARVLPWRGVRDPYRTWVSETMLQQTRVETVIGYYQRFLERFPTVEALAEADQDEVLKLWEGLGYYSRARNLHKGAKQVMADFGGQIPSDVDTLRGISGIGPYTAGAISSIAFEQPVPAVDGNVIRVVSRLRGIRDNVGIPSVRRALEGEAAALVPDERPGDFNQALMDLGARICTPGTPACEQCPLRDVCDAFDADDAEELPVLPRKNPPRQLEYDVCLIFSGDRVLMRQRTETMLHALWVYPMLEEWHSPHELTDLIRRKLRLCTDECASEGEARHVFTHQVWNMHLYSLHVSADAAAPEGWQFFTLEEMQRLTIPTAMKAPLRIARERLQRI